MPASSRPRKPDANEAADMSTDLRLTGGQQLQSSGFTCFAELDLEKHFPACLTILLLPDGNTQTDL